MTILYQNEYESGIQKKHMTERTLFLNSMVFSFQRAQTINRIEIRFCYYCWRESE